MGWKVLAHPMRSLAIAVLATAVVTMAVIILAHAAAGEDTPPTVELTKPAAGTRLGATAQVNGVARDAEGFNISSFVQLRFDDLAWFQVLSTPGDNGSTLAFGTFVDMSPFTPGEHLLSTRAYDGLLWSEEVNITVVVRDLPDLVVFPTDIRLDPPDAEGGEDARLVVVVHNNGGEDATDVVVRAVWDGAVLGEVTLARVAARSNATARLDVALAAGTSNVTVHVGLPTPQQERSLDNNAATATFVLDEQDTSAFWNLVLIGLAATATMAVLVMLYVYARRARRGDGPRNH